VDVARERDDGGRRAAALSRRHLRQQLGETREPAEERCPVVEVERLANPLAELRRGLAPRARADLLVPGLQVVEGGREQVRIGHREQEVVEVAADRVAEPLPLLVVEHEALALAEHPARATIDPDEARAAEVAAEAPAAALPRAVRLEREAAEERPGVVRLLRPFEDLVLAKLRRREVPEVLVEPVGHERAHDPLVPPRLRPHPRHPVVRDVPVVVDVVVVEEHRARDGRQEPPDRRVLPRLPVEARVLLEVGHLLVWRLRRVAARADELERPRRDLVRVDLVAHEKDRPRPLLGGLSMHAKGVGVEGIEPAAALVLFGQERVGRLVRERDAARAEEDPQAMVAADRPDHARREGRPLLGPHALAVEHDLVGVRDARLEPFDDDEAVVVALHVERARPMAEHLDLARRVGLDPERRVVLAEMAEERAQDQLRHLASLGRGGAPAGGAAP
jgi:hypothetical protein